jgi:hypothetical protein
MAGTMCNQGKFPLTSTVARVLKTPILPTNCGNNRIWRDIWNIGGILNNILQ